MSDHDHEPIIAALKQALAQPGEHRLHRAAKLPGLFAAKSEAAHRAIADGLFTVIRTETKGKSTTEWVHLTPKGVDFLHEHESPLAVLRELRDALTTTRGGIPAWLDQMHQQWQTFAVDMVEQMRQMLTRLDALSERVEEALRRADAIGPKLPGTLGTSIPWALDALTYLDRRKQSGAKDGCPLPELFAAVRRPSPGLSLSEFQTGLRRLADQAALRLLPFAGPADQLPEPEYALLDGASVLYYAAR